MKNARVQRQRERLYRQFVRIYRNAISGEEAELKPIAKYIEPQPLPAYSQPPEKSVEVKTSYYDADKMRLDKKAVWGLAEWHRTQAELVRMAFLSTTASILRPENEPKEVEQHKAWAVLLERVWNHWD